MKPPREHAAAGETECETDDGRYVVAERNVAEEGATLISEHTYEIEQYLLYTLKYRVQAESGIVPGLAEAIALACSTAGCNGG